MPSKEHRVSVDNGAYTFVLPADSFRVSILRHDEPWHGPQAEGSHALQAIMCELDAARVVVAAVRQRREAAAGDLHIRIIRALQAHDGLTSDRTPPSPWAMEVPGDNPSMAGQRAQYGTESTASEATVTAPVDVSADERELVDALRADPSLLRAIVDGLQSGPRGPRPDAGISHELLEVRMFALGRGYRRAAACIGQLRASIVAPKAEEVNK